MTFPGGPKDVFGVYFGLEASKMVILDNFRFDIQSLKFSYLKCENLNFSE